MTNQRVAILSAVRTPIGKYLGGLSEVPAVDLGLAAARAAIERSGLAAGDIEEVIFGNARQAGNAPNPARQVGVRAGVAHESPAMTINQACGSSLKALLLGAQSIRLGEARAVLVGGTESMSRVPFSLEGLRKGWKMGHQPLVDNMYRDGFLCPLCHQVMGETAETLAQRYSISRAEQDDFALRSQNRADAARTAGRFDAEIVPVQAPAGRGQVTVAADEHIRANAVLADMAKLPPVFSKEGTVTAGNACGMTDGAAALVLCDKELAGERGVPVLAWLEDGVVAGVDPSVMGLGPVPAVRKLLARGGTTLADFDLVELNEAFAAQVLACDRELKFDPERLNVNGGAIALGHPIGATGARLVVTLLHEMKRRDAARGLATLCVSGGLGLAASFRRGRN